MKLSKKFVAFCLALTSVNFLAYIQADGAAFTAIGMITGAFLVAQGGKDTAAAWKQPPG